MNLSKPSFIFLGSKPGSVIALLILLQKGWTVDCVVSSERQNDKFDGPFLDDYAARHGIPVVKQEDLVRRKKVDYVISYMYRFKIKQKVLQLARVAALNFHAGPLPEYAGWYFYNMAILNRARTYGCTCHHMETDFDSGAIVKLRNFPIDAERETTLSLERKTQAEMLKLFLDVCRMIQKKETLPAIAQDKKKRRFLSKEQFDCLKQIPPHADQETIERYARAFWFPPYEGAYLLVTGAKIEVLPKIAKEQIARALRQQDYLMLKKSLRLYKI